MAIDVLQFNAQKEQNNAYRNTTLASCLRTFNTLNAQLQNVCCVDVVLNQLRAFPWDCSLYSLVPSLPSVTCAFRVCDTSSAFNAGVCCTWTVPSGLSFIRFQMWGAGAPTDQAFCCGFSMAGSGAYASVIIPAVAGCQYTICSGCAFLHCCSACCIAGCANGCASFVQGFGLNNVCAEGGAGCTFCYLRTLYGTSASQCSSLASPMIYSRDYTGDLATSWSVDYRMGWWDCSPSARNNFCFNGASCAAFITTNEIPIIASCRTFYGTTNFPTVNGGSVFGIPGMYPGISTPSLGCANICFCLPPVFNGPACRCNVCIGSGTSCGGACCIEDCNGGAQLLPGAGGFPVSVQSGTCIAGARGRMGMVCVQAF